MNGPFQDFDELRALLEALCEESVTADQLRRLEELVLARPEAEAYYVQFMHLHAHLSRHFALAPALTEEALRDRVGDDSGVTTASSGDKETRRPGDKETKVPGGHEGRSGTSRRRFSLSPLLLVSVSGLAAALLFTVALWPRPRAVQLPPGTGPEPLDNSVAVLLQAPGAEWGETELPTRVGAPLPPGRLRLKAGFAHIEFYSGATVILEGPADFQLISSREAYCARGRLRATVPPQAQGFAIGSPKLDLVDRGTEFGLEVGGDKTEVHVFHGKVDLYDAGTDHEDQAARQELRTGQGVRLDGPGQPRPIRSDPAAFTTAREVTERWEAEVRRRQRAWTEASEALRRDPSLVVYYTFQPEHSWSRTLSDQAANAQHPHDGAIVGCAWVTGRWPGKQALEFKRVSDRVRFSVPGEFESLTLAAWVRVDAVPNRFNSLMMTDAWLPAAPHWHIGVSGKLELGVQGVNKQKGVHYLSPDVFTPERLGQWTHLAVVYDREVGQVTHYVDGQPVAQEDITMDIPLVLGDAQLGNWNVGNRPWERSPIRFFTGCMDEFMLFARPLGGMEIEQLHAQGKPPS